jgi:flagellar basal-body rod modification protein FlgD
MPQGVAKGTINIANSSGLNVFFADAEKSSGKHTVEWDGKDKSGNQLDDGVYTLLVSGQDSSGNLVDVEHLVVGPVTGAGVDDGVVKLFINGAITVDQSEILSVRKTASEAPTP